MGALVLLNPGAGGGRSGRLRLEIERWLRQQHPAASLHVTASVHEARSLLERAPRGSRVVVAGGDGSVHQVLPQLIAGGHEMAVLPLGSGDDGARALGVHQLPWPRALQRGLLGPALPVDVGWISTEHEERPFFANVACGFDGASATEAQQLPRWLRGVPRYGLGTLRALAALAQIPVEVEVDGERVHQGPTLLASSFNTATYGGGFLAAPPARIDDGRLHLLLATGFNRRRVLSLLPRVMKGRHLGQAGVQCLPFQRLQLRAEQPLQLAADGEVLSAAQRITVRVGVKLLLAVVGEGFERSR